MFRKINIEIAKKLQAFVHEKPESCVQQLDLGISLIGTILSNLWFGTRASSLILGFVDEYIDPGKRLFKQFEISKRIEVYLYIMEVQGDQISVGALVTLLKGGRGGGKFLAMDFLIDFNSQVYFKGYVKLPK